MLSRCSRENQEEVGYSKADNDNAYSYALVATSEYEYVSYIAKVNLKAEHVDNWKVHFQTIHALLVILF